jgi:hypothetical protein
VTTTLHVACPMMLQAQAFIDFSNGYVESTITLASLPPLNPSPIVNFLHWLVSHMAQTCALQM